MSATSPNPDNPLDPVPGGPRRVKSDLGVRTVSAIVMIAVAGAALWLGGLVFAGFVALIGLGVLWEWWNLARRITSGAIGRAVWLIAGIAYIGLACWTLATLRMMPDEGLELALRPILLVICVDVGAYFAGRTIGGPKIAKRISPSKTWAGLFGAILAATAAEIWRYSDNEIPLLGLLPMALGVGAMCAVVAQAGDFFESWMKRRAGVKDSSALIPGHGGLFDRVDGLLAILLLIAIMQLTIDM